MKLARAQVVWDSAEKGLQGPIELRDEKVSRQFPGVAKRVKTIEDQYRDLWTFWIAIDRKYIAHAAAVVSTIEDLIGIKCDPVFSETYLRQVPGFQQAASRTAAIHKALSALEPEVDDLLGQMAALDGQPHADSQTVLGAIRSVANKETAAKKEDVAQSPLFSGTESADPEPSKK
jgi:hypothetical protein